MDNLLRLWIGIGAVVIGGLIWWVRDEMRWTRLVGLTKEKYLI